MIGTLAAAALKYGPAAYSLGKSLFGGGSKKGGSSGGDRRGQEARVRFDDQARREGHRGRELTGGYDEAITGFDPMEYANTAAGGMFNTFKRDLGRNVSDLRGEQVGMGRLRTGYGTQDEDRLFSDMGDNLNNRIASLSMQGAGMEMGRINSMGAAGERATDRSMDANFGSYATEREARERDRASRRGMVGNIGGALLNAGATYFANRRN